MGVSATVKSTAFDHINFKDSINSNLSMSNQIASFGEDREEGEIIDEFEDIISSDEEFSMRKRIEELEAKNAELEKIANISGTYGNGRYDNSRKDNHHMDRYPLVSIDVSDEEDYPPAPKIPRLSKRRKSLQHSSSSRHKFLYPTSSSHRRRKRSSSPPPAPQYRESDKLLLSFFHQRVASHSNKKKRKSKKSHSSRSSRKSREVNHTESDEDNTFATHGPNFNESYESLRQSSDGDKSFSLNREELRVALARNTHRSEQNVSLKDRLIRRKENTDTLNEKKLLESEEKNETVLTTKEKDDSDNDLEEQELRILALKSAMIRKAIVRKKRNENIAYSPSDLDFFTNMNVSPSINNIDDVEECNSMEISPVPSPKLMLSDDCGIDTKPIDMDIANSDSDCELPSYEKWIPIEQIPLPNSEFKSEELYAPTPLRCNTAVDRCVVPPLVKDENALVSPKNIDSEIEEEELALRALLLAKLNSPKNNKVVKQPVKQLKKVNTSETDTSLEAENLRIFLINNMKKKVEPKLSSASVLKEAVRRLTARNSSTSPADSSELSQRRTENQTSQPNIKTEMKTIEDLSQAITDMANVRIGECEAKIKVTHSDNTAIQNVFTSNNATVPKLCNSANLLLSQKATKEENESIEGTVLKANLDNIKQDTTRYMVKKEKVANEITESQDLKIEIEDVCSKIIVTKQDESAKVKDSEILPKVVIPKETSHNSGTAIVNNTQTRSCEVSKEKTCLEETPKMIVKKFSNTEKSVIPIKDHKTIASRMLLESNNILKTTNPKIILKIETEDKNGVQNKIESANVTKQQCNKYNLVKGCYTELKKNLTETSSAQESYQITNLEESIQLRKNEIDLQEKQQHPKSSHESISNQIICANSLNVEATNHNNESIDPILIESEKVSNTDGYINIGNKEVKKQANNLCLETESSQGIAKDEGEKLVPTKANFAKTENIMELTFIPQTVQSNIEIPLKRPLTNKNKEPSSKLTSKTVILDKNIAKTLPVQKSIQNQITADAKSTVSASSKIPSKQPIVTRTKIIKPNKVINQPNPDLKRKPTENVSKQQVPIKKVKTEDSSRLITTTEIPKVKQLVIQLRPSDTESEYSTLSDDDYENKNDDNSGSRNLLNSSITIGNEYYDIASPISLPMESPRDTPTLVGSPFVSRTNTPQPQVEKSIVNDFFEAKLEQFLKNVRSKVGDCKKKPITDEKHNVVTPINSTPVAVRHLPEASQQEYRRLINRMKMLERQKQAKNLQVVVKSNKNILDSNNLIESSSENLLTRKVLVKNFNVSSDNEIAPNVELIQKPTSAQKQKKLNDELAVIPTKSTLSPSKNNSSKPKSEEAKPSKENLLILYENSYHKTGANILINLNKSIELVRIAKEAKVKKLKQEQRLKELRKEMEEVQKNIQEQQQRITKIYPEICSSHRMIESLKTRRLKINKAVTALGKNVVGPNYSMKNDQKPLILKTSKLLAAEIKLVNTMKFCDLEKIETQNIVSPNKSDLVAPLKDLNNINEKQASTHFVDIPKSIETLEIATKVPVCDSERDIKSQTNTSVPETTSKMDHKLNDVILVPETLSKKVFGINATNSHEEAFKTKPVDDNVDDLCGPNIVEEGMLQENDEKVGGAKLQDYVSPLGHIREERQINPNGIVCPYQLMGQCDDKDCKYMHLEM